MSQQQNLLALLERGRGMLRMHLNDFSDSDMLVRPTPAANHAAYQLAHLLRTTSGLVRAFAPDAAVALPPKVEGDAKAPPTSDDPAAFPSKHDLLDAFESLVTAIAGGVATMSDADFDKPAPEQFQRMAATLGQMAMMVPFHMSMHVGQIQVIRRVLGKPRLF